MLSPEHIAFFYDSVLCKEESDNAISQSTIQSAIRNMAKAYKPDKTNLNRQEVSVVADYNDTAHRCAYLHKYAPLHTCLVQDLFHIALTECYILRNNMYSRYDSFNICSLGGGPGTDIIGIISALQPFGFLPVSAHVVDLMSGWESTFNSLVEEFRNGCHGNLSVNFHANYFNFSYTSANLLHTMDNNVCRSIESADLVTMVKFVSAAACKNTENMLKKIFNNLKPGAMVLFIDNAAGGFRQMISRSAAECELVTIYGPLKHVHYLRPEFNIVKYGYTRCFETKVTVQVLIKLSQPKFFHPNQNLSNPSHSLLPERPVSGSSGANRIVLNSKPNPYSKVSKPSLSNTHLATTSSDITPLHQNLGLGFANNGPTQTSTKHYGTNTSAKNIQSQKRELPEKSNQRMGAALAKGVEHLPSAKHFKSQKHRVDMNLPCKINEGLSSIRSLKTNACIAPNANVYQNLPVSHASLNEISSKSGLKKVATISPTVNSNSTRQPVSDSFIYKALNTSVHKKSELATPIAKGNPSREPASNVFPSKTSNSSVPKNVAAVAPFVTKPIQSKIVSSQPLATEEASSSVSNQDQLLDQKQTNLEILYRAIMKCLCMNNCCGV